MIYADYLPTDYKNKTILSLQSALDPLDLDAWDRLSEQGTDPEIRVGVHQCMDIHYQNFDGYDEQDVNLISYG